LTFDKIQARANKIMSQISARDGKYIRNLNRYSNNGSRREDLWTPYVWPQAYVTAALGTDGTQTQFNFTKSAVDTFVSKISGANVRPYVMPIAGDYETSRTAKSLQHYFDVWLDEQHAYPKSVMCMRDAAIFEYGVIGLNTESLGLERIPPWEYALDPAEYQAGTITMAVRGRKSFPLAALVGKIREKGGNEELLKRFEDNPQEKSNYVQIWDLYNGEKWEIFGNQQLSEPEKLDYEQYGGLYRRPFVEIYYTKPLKGSFSTSLVDDLYPIQRQVDELVKRLDVATRNSVISMIMVPKQSGIKASDIENGVHVYEYLPGEGGSIPVTCLTPPPVSPAYRELLEFYRDQMYEISGISKLSAQSKAPSNLDSGKALDTMEDIESERFNTQLQQFVHFLVDVVRVAIDCFPKGKPVIKKVGLDKVTWGDARRQRDTFSLQFSAASSLSKNPESKMAEIEFMQSQGLIDRSQIAQFYDQPDLQGAFSEVNAELNYVECIIDRCIKDGDTEFNETVNLDLLKKKVLKQINLMEAAGDEQKYIDRLVELLKAVNDMQKSLEQWTTPAPPATPPVPAPPPPPPEPIRSTVLDGSQITAIAGLQAQVKSGQIDPASAVALLVASGIAQESASQMIPQGMGALAPTENIEGAPNA
jgi:hypothetical protein